MNRNATLAAAGFVATIPAANWTLDRVGFLHLGPLGSVPSGVLWVGLAFVLRDIAQLLTTKWHTLAAIAIGVGASYWLADPRIATASGLAFGLSELLDWAIYTPLAARRFVTAVLLSSLAGGALDSALFVRVAFHSYAGWWQLAIVKALIVAAATPVAAAYRTRALPRHLA